MRDATANEILVMLKIFKTPEKEFNANSISKETGLSSMGALKILKNLEKEGILIPKEAGRAKFYSIDFGNEYAKDYLKFILRREAEQSSPYIKRWINEIRSLKNADAAILFGSVLTRESKANDVDVLLVTSQKKFEELKKEINELNKISEKNIHAIYQSSEDLQNNIQKQDKVVLNALKGVVALGEKKIIEMLK